MKNYYEILEVSENASKEVIEKAYNTLVSKYHPDLFYGEAKELVERKVKEINEAYSVLSDNYLRDQYNKEYKINSNFTYVEENKTESEQEETNNKDKKDKKEKKEKKDIFGRPKKEYTVGTIDSMSKMTKAVFSNIPKIEWKKPSKKGVLSLIAAIIIVLGLVTALYFIPFTHDFIVNVFF